MYKSVNRWLYGPTPEEKVRSWQQRLRQETRQLDREMGRVRRELNIPGCAQESSQVTLTLCTPALHIHMARFRS
jgi:hypothetical protein